MRRTLLLLTILVCFGASKSSAVVDSIYANNQIAISVTNPEYALGAPDGQQARINSTGELWLRFDHNGLPLNFAPGSIIHIYWSKQLADTVAAVVSLVHVNQNWVESSKDSLMIVDQPGMITITVPAAGFNAVHFRLTGNPPATGGSAAFFVDAATLIQDNLSVGSSAPMAVFNLYPNPATVSSGISVTAPQEFVGHAELVVHNILGNEVERLPVDAATIHVAMASRGSYIATLLVDGVPTGKSYKFSVE
jgi:hypothetical protein